MSLFFLIVFACVAVFLIASGVPLIRGRIAPNALYGFRTQTTLVSPEIWYRVNRVLGKWLVATGTIIGLVAVALYWSGLRPEASAGINLPILLVGILAATVHGLMLQKQPGSGRHDAS